MKQIVSLVKNQSKSIQYIPFNNMSKLKIGENQFKQYDAQKIIDKVDLRGANAQYDNCCNFADIKDIISINTGSYSDNNAKDYRNMYLMFAGIVGYLACNINDKLKSDDSIILNDKGPVGANYVNQLAQDMQEINEELSRVGNTQRAIFVCGDTGAGKSTLINYLTGQELIPVKVPNRNTYTINTKDASPHIPIGHGRTAQTKMPKVALDNDTGLLYVDTPGFKDTQGSKVDIKNTFAINKFFNSTKEVKIIVVVEESEILGGSRGQAFIDLMHTLHTRFKNRDKLINSIAIVISKSKDISNPKKELIDIVTENDSPNAKENKAFLLSVLNKAHVLKFQAPEAPKLYGLLGGGISTTDKAKIMAAISQIDYVETPKIRNAFSGDNARMIQDASKSVDAEVSLHMANLTKSVKNQIKKSDIPMASLENIKANFKKFAQSFQAIKNPCNKDIIKLFDHEVLNGISGLFTKDKNEVLDYLTKIKKLLETYENVFGDVFISDKDGSNEQHVTMNTGMYLYRFLKDVGSSTAKLIAIKQKDQELLAKIQQYEKDSEDKFKNLKSEFTSAINQKDAQIGQLQKSGTPQTGYSDAGAAVGTAIVPGVGTLIGWGLGRLCDIWF